MPAVYEIRLSANCPSLPGRLIGRLVWDDAARIRARSMAFQYDAAWLRTGFALGADLPLKPEVQYLPDAFGAPGRRRQFYERSSLFGFLADTAPGFWWSDWAQAARINRLDHPLMESLPGPGQLWASMGSNLKRFSALTLPAVPSYQTESGIDYFEKKRFASLVDSLQRLREAPDSLRKSDLLALVPVLSDLGGVSVKALVTGKLSPSGALTDWVLRPADLASGLNSARWQAIGMKLASLCGLSTVEGGFIENTFGGAYVEKRFDRDAQGRPLFCLSAATLAARRKRPGQPAVLPGWADAADILNRSGASPLLDLKELFRRLLFDTLVMNRHDALSDLWFYRTDAGWKLAPLAGVRLLPPEQRARLLSTPILRNDTAADPELALEASRYFGVSVKDAKEMLLDMQRTVSDWRKVAADFKAGRQELEAAAGTFWSECQS